MCICKVALQNHVTTHKPLQKMTTMSVRITKLIALIKALMSFRKLRTKCWMIATSKGHVKNSIQGGFEQAYHGKSTLLKKIKKTITLFTIQVENILMEKIYIKNLLLLEK